VFQAWPTRPLTLWPFSPLTSRPTPLRRARSELRPQTVATPRVPSAMSLGWIPSSPSLLSCPGCPSVFPLVTAPTVASSLSAARTPFFSAPPARPVPSSLFPVWARASHPQARWPPCLASLLPQSPARAPPPPSHGTSTPEPHSHGHNRRALDPCVTSFRRCRSQSSLSSSKSPEPPSVVPLLRASPLPILCAPPAMALSDSPSGPLAPP
jgi:hypothetical protein